MSTYLGAARRHRGARVVLLVIAVAAVCLGVAAPASAIIVRLSNGHILSYMAMVKSASSGGANSGSAGAPAGGSAQSCRNCDSIQHSLDYGGGPVMTSNTNYVIAGVIVEKASGQPLLQFLSERVFTPLGMKSVANIDQEKLGETDPTGYLRYALGPLRPAPKEGKGWLFARGPPP